MMETAYKTKPTWRSADGGGFGFPDLLLVAVLAGRSSVWRDMATIPNEQQTVWIHQSE